MPFPKIFESEYQFCLILWAHEPVKSKELVRLCKEQLGWKPTTTYTVIKRLSDRGVLKKEKTIVNSLVSKDDVQMAEINDFLERRFDGSFPDFLLAYSKHQRLSDEERTVLQAIIDKFRNQPPSCVIPPEGK